MRHLRWPIAGTVLLLTVVSAGCASGPAPRAGNSKISANPGGCPPAPARRGAATPAGAATSAGAPTAARTGSGRWPQRTVLPEGTDELSSAQAADPASGMVYALISRGATAAQGPYVLQRTALRTGTRCRGRTFPVDDLTIASGYLWISGFPGSTTRPVIFQVNPSSLAVVRSIRPPAVPAVATGSHVPVTAGPGGTVWAGWFRTLLRLNAATGATEATAALPPGLAVSDLSADPASNHLYVVAARVTKDGEEGAAVAEYDAQSGHRLALTTRDPLGFSVVGGAASAAPGAVAVSFRTGMMGLTVLLGAKDLAVITLPHTGAQAGRSDDIFHWAMSASTAYGGGALWLMNENGIVACVDPATGRIRAREHVPLSGTAPRILAVDQSSIVTLGPRGLVRITPPRPCWAASA